MINTAYLTDEQWKMFRHNYRAAYAYLNRCALNNEHSDLLKRVNTLDEIELQRLIYIETNYIGLHDATITHAALLHDTRLTGRPLENSNCTGKMRHVGNRVIDGDSVSFFVCDDCGQTIGQGANTVARVFKNY